MKALIAIAIAILLYAVCIVTPAQEASSTSSAKRHHHHSRHHASGSSHHGPSASPAPARHGAPRKRAPSDKVVGTTGPMSPAPKELASAAPGVPALPPPPPVVISYQRGTLAIIAQDAALRDVLDRIHESTGAVIEAPSLEQRVSVRLDARPPVQTIAALFEGLPLSYAILGGATEEDPLQRVIITHVGPAVTLSQAAIDAAAAKARADAMAYLNTAGDDQGAYQNQPQAPSQLPAFPYNPADIRARRQHQ